MQRMAGKFLRQASQGKSMMSAEFLTSFCGSAVSLTLTVPLAMFYTRLLYSCLSYARREGNGKRARVRLSKTSRRKLLFWRRLEPESRCMRGPGGGMRSLGCNRLGLGRHDEPGHAPGGKRSVSSRNRVSGGEVCDDRLEGI